eukprot:SAG22_NODE_2669_length_2320_cov_1.458352_3_plen_77_part_00
MLAYCLADLKRRHKVTLDKQKDGRAIRRLWQACDAAKRSLSSSESVMIEVDGLSGAYVYMAQDSNEDQRAITGGAF